VIRNVVIHISNEQPLLADLFSVPSAADVALVCTNIRMMDGKKPIFIDRTDSTFFFPNLHIRFLEVPNAELARHLATAGPEAGLAPGLAAAGGPGESAALDPDQRLPIPIGDGGVTLDPTTRPGPEPEPDLDIDEGFLQRVRDI
jgi:hypothetical protein